MSEDPRDKRSTQRFQVLGHAQLRAGHMVINCVIRDLSQDGARLGISASARIPAKSEFWLVQGGVKTRVVPRWREGNHIGVAFAKKGSPANKHAGADKQVILDA